VVHAAVNAWFYDAKECKQDVSFTPGLSSRPITSGHHKCLRRLKALSCMRLHAACACPHAAFEEQLRVLGADFQEWQVRQNQFLPLLQHPPAFASPPQLFLFAPAPAWRHEDHVFRNYPLYRESHQQMALSTCGSALSTADAPSGL